MVGRVRIPYLEDLAIVKDKSTTRWPLHWELYRGREHAVANGNKASGVKADCNTRQRGQAHLHAIRSRWCQLPSTPQEPTDDSFLGIEELVDDHAPFANRQLDSRGASRSTFRGTSHALSPATSHAASLATSRVLSPEAVTSTTKKKHGRTKGSKNNPRKKRSSSRSVVETSASSYNARCGRRRSNYARLDDLFSSE